MAGFGASCTQLATTVTSWNGIRNRELAGFNGVRSSHQMATITAAGADLAVPSCPPAAGSARTRPGARPAGNTQAADADECVGEECEMCDDPEGCGN